MTTFPACFTRVPISWAGVQAKPRGPLNWSEVDQAVEQVSLGGLEVLPFICGTPTWLGNTKTLPVNNARQRNAWSAFLKAAVERYGWETQPPFEILIDETRDVVKAYGVWHRIGLDAWNISRPAVFLIDRDRSIRYSFIGKSQTEFPNHDEILKAI